MFSRYLCLSLLCLFLSGCFEIIEEVTYKGKDNGTFTLITNCSKSKTSLKTLLKLDTFMGAKIPNEYEIREYVNKVTEAVKATPGTSEVTSTVDMDNYIFSITFGFDKTETLNLAINNAAKTVNKKMDLAYMNIFSFADNQFVRHNMLNDSNARLEKIRPAALKLISDASITSIYRFTGEVKTISNKKALISKNRKAVMLKQNITKVIDNPEILTNSITF